MKIKVLDFIVKMLMAVAVICASTPSRLGMYELEKPANLK